MAKKEQDELKEIPVVDIDTEEGMTLEESMAKAVMLLGTVKGEHSSKILSEVSDNEVRLCSALFVVAEKTNDTMLKNFLSAFLLLRVSKLRQGRKEILDIARASRDQSESRMSRIKSLFMGGQR